MAEKHLRIALSINSNVFGSDSCELAEACFLLGRVLIVLNNENEGLKLYLEAIKVYEKTETKNNPKYADVYVELGRFYQNKKDYQNSLSALQGALRILHDNSIDVDMAGIATVHFIAGNVLKEMGNLNDAIFHMTKSLEIRKRVLGRNRILAHTMSSLGVCYADANEHEKSLNLLKKALELDRELLGEFHQDVATDLNNVSVLYADVGNFNEALKHMNECMEIRLNLFGDKHPSYGSCLNNKGCILRALGKIDEAKELLEMSVEHGIACLGEDDIDVALRKNNLAEIFQEKKHLEQAETLYYEVLNCWTEKLGALHPRVGIAASNLALLLTDMGKVEEAFSYQQQALDINLRAYGELNGAVARD